MNDTVWIVLIVALAVVVVLFIFRSSLSSFFLKANKEGLEAKLQTHEPADNQANPAPSSSGVTISGNRQLGDRNKIVVERDQVNVRDNVQTGRRQEIEVKPDQQE
jgi:hypothetical protein